MTSKLKHVLFLFVALWMMGSLAMAQIPDDIIVSLKTGNAASLSKYFSQNVELVVLETENVYSRSHAQQVLNDFFKKYPPQNFSLIHQGGKDNSSYAIGNLQVKSDKFRVYFLLKEINGQSYIHQLRIERQSK